MKLVIDTNVIISALIKESITREIILDSNHLFVSPDFLVSEINKHRELIKEKSGLSEEKLEVVLQMLLREIEILPREEYNSSMEKAEDILGEIDQKDVPFLACALAKNCPVWSDDKDFQKQDQVDVYTTTKLRNQRT